MGEPEGLKSSIHSSVELAFVPAHATSLMTIAPGLTAVAVAVGVAVGKVVELICRGVPLTGLLLASRPLRCRVSFVNQLKSLSASVEIQRSMLALLLLLPAGHAPPSPLAVSITLPPGSRRVSI